MNVVTEIKYFFYTFLTGDYFCENGAICEHHKTCNILAYSQALSVAVVNDPLSEVVLLAKMFTLHLNFKQFSGS